MEPSKTYLLVTKHFYVKNFVWFLLGCTFALYSLPLAAQPGYNDFPVERFTPEQGFDNATPTCFLQDRTGVMWIGTENGLYRYDGTFRLYARQANNPLSLSHNVVTALCEDKEGILWVGTLGGLNRFDRARNECIRYVYRAGDSSSLASDKIEYLYNDAEGRLWVIAKSILHRFNKHSGKVARRYYPKKFSAALDGSGKFLLKQGEELLQYDERNDTFTLVPFTLPADAEMFLNSGSDTLWFVANHALNALNVRTGATVSRFQMQNFLGSGIPQFVVATTPDRIWFRTWSALYQLNILTGTVRKCIPSISSERLEPSRPSGGPGAI